MAPAGREIGGLETYCPRDSVIVEEGLYYSGLSCIALMSQYVCCNGVLN